MESSNTEINATTSSLTKSNHAATGITNLNAHRPPLIAKIALHPSGKRHLSPSSSINSSPDSPLDDPFKSDDDDDVDDDNSISGSEPSSPSHKNDQIPIITSNSCPPVNNIGSAKEPPGNQAMERATSKYRIPSSVFARSKPEGQQMDWSMASNESLFSIHGTGNMSFTNDNVFWRSGEQGGPAVEEASTSDHMFSYSTRQPKCAEIMRSRELGLAEATMKEVIRESESHQHYVTSLAEESRSCRGSGSGTSAKSFAFSIKEGDSRKGASPKIPRSAVTSISEEPVQCQPKPLVKAESTAQPSTNHEPKTSPAPKPNSAHHKWPSCFSCCSLWSS